MKSYSSCFLPLQYQNCSQYIDITMLRFMYDCY